MSAEVTATNFCTARFVRVNLSYAMSDHFNSIGITYFNKGPHFKSILHHAGNGYLSASPTGDPIANQHYVTTLEKGITIIFPLCLNLTLKRISASVFSSSLGIVDIQHIE